MKIKYENIDNAIMYFENKQFSDKSEKEFIGQFPEILSYLTSNQFSILSEDEYMILIFDAMVLIKTIIDQENQTKEIDHLMIEARESENWDLFESLGSISFDEKVDKLFKNENEDIIDFILSSFDDEDEVEDDMEISDPAKEVIILALKTIFDCFSEDSI